MSSSPLTVLTSNRSSRDKARLIAGWLSLLGLRCVLSARHHTSINTYHRNAINITDQFRSIFSQIIHYLIPLVIHLYPAGLLKN